MAETTIKVVTFSALQNYHAQITDYIDAADARSIKTVAIEGNLLKFYRVDEPVGTTEPAYQIELPETDISNLLEKIENATAGNVVVANADGTVADGGVALADLATKAEVKTVDDKVAANTEAIDSINDAETGILKQAKDYADTKDEAISNAQTAADEAGAAAEKAQGDVDALAEKVSVLEKSGYDDTEVRELIGANTEEITGLKDKDTEIEGRIKVNEDAIATLTGEGEGSVKKTVDDALNKFATDVTNDEVVNSYKELIDWAATHGSEAAEMVDAISANELAIADLEKLVGTLPEGATATTVVALIQELVTAEQSRAEGVESGLDTRLNTVEEILGDGEGSVTELIANAKQEAIETAAGDATEKANKALTDAKAYTDEEVAKDRTRLEALEAIDHEHSNLELLETYTQTEENLADAVAKKHEHENKTVLDGITEGKVTAWDASEQNAKDYADGLNTAMTTRVDEVVEGVNDHEDRIATLESVQYVEVTEEEISSLFGETTTLSEISNIIG